MPLDARALARALGQTAPPALLDRLCRNQLDRLEEALATGEPVLVACEQEVALFAETAGEAADRLRTVDIRARAGWSAEATQATPKIAALLAEAALEPPPVPVVTLRSQGRCLVYGPAEPALEVAGRLAGRLTPTLVLTEARDVLPPARVRFPILTGRIARLEGHLGAFRATVADAAMALPSSRERLRFGPPSPKTEIEADLVLDLSGGTPLVTAADKRDGYQRVDPRDPLALERALFDLVDLVGELEKPRWVELEASSCAHSRSRRVGCTRCLDHCPTGAITPAGDHVAIDPFVCAGCGACAGLCPTGAIGYAAPPAGFLLERLRTLLGTWRAAGGADAVLLVHESRHGEPLLDAMARTGRGLPARVLPFAVEELARLGLEALMAPFALGAAQLVVLEPPHKAAELGALAANLGWLEALLDGLGYGRDRLVRLSLDDPEALEAALWSLPPFASAGAADFVPLGGKRALLRLVADALHASAPKPVSVVPLPPGAPFGRVVVEVEGCTLCHACVGACPTGALQAHPDKPMLRFTEDACVQCGLCVNTCPEKVIRLEPRLGFGPAFREAVVLKEEEPFRCVRCGKPFGTKSSIEKIVQRLAGSHWMFRDARSIERLRMCDDCRVVSEFERPDHPMALGTPRRPRTTEDYLREREAEEAARRAARDGEGKG